VLFVVLLFLLVLVHLSWWQHGEKILRMRAEQKEGTRPMRATCGALKADPMIHL
jgi:hypothetical protein